MNETRAPSPWLTSSVDTRLRRGVCRLAARLADALDRAILGDGALTDARGFLRTMSLGADDRELDVTEEAVSASPLDRLIEAFGLSSLELDLVLLAGLAEEHEGFSAVLRALHPRGEPRPTVGLATQLLCRSAAERRLFRATIECGTARRAGIVRISADAPFPDRSLELADSLWPVLQGLDVWPAALTLLPGTASPHGLEGWLVSTAVSLARTAMRERARVTILFTADDVEQAMRRASVLAERVGVSWVALHGPSFDEERETLIAVHAAARGAVPIVGLTAAIDGSVPAAPTFAICSGPVVLCVRHTGRVAGARPVLAVPVERLGPAARCTMWAQTMPELATAAPLLAARYAVEPSAAAQIARDARGAASLDGRSACIDDVGRSVRVRAGLGVAGAVRLRRATATWDQLVLSQERRRQLREAVERLLHQPRVIDEWGFLRDRAGARGVRLLFSGPPGTGKTLSAEVLAAAVGVDLLTVDLSRILSKWLGESEKNLAEVFDLAERTQAVLFFDEADALFGKRTDISDAHDRYANLETSYLLMRLERYEGMAVLSTNLRKNVDVAFMRRLEFVVEFEPPDVDERQALWQCHLPDAAPLARDVDARELAVLYPLVGGAIRNAAVAAAFAAAAAGTTITREQLVCAVRREYEKAGRAFPGAPAGLDAA